jgi:RNA polymerase sigma factor (sigma-70 family)
MSPSPDPHDDGDPVREDLDRLVGSAQDGDRRALEALITGTYERVYRLALRMTARPPDAEDATQEILIKVITRLSTFRGEAAFTTWVHRIAVNHLLDRAKSCVEQMDLTFESYAADLLDGLAATPTTAPDAAMLEREVQLACTHAMLTCLDREHRIAYILGDIFRVGSTDGAFICGVSPTTYRKRLSRARQRVRTFLASSCGLVDDAAACRCSRRVDVAIASGRIRPERLEFTDHTQRVNDDIIRLHDAAQLLRSLPDATIPSTMRRRISAIIRASTVAAEHASPPTASPAAGSPSPTPGHQPRATHHARLAAPRR